MPKNQTFYPYFNYYQLDFGSYPLKFAPKCNMSVKECNMSVSILPTCFCKFTNVKTGIRPNQQLK